VTYLHLGPSLDAALWALAQIALVLLAAFDVQSRRLPNWLTLPTAAAAVALRAVFERSSLLEVVVAGLATFAIFWVIALAMRGGLGLGDVKLAGMLGFLLGSAVLPGIFIGVVVGGAWSAFLLVSGRARLHSTMAYGQFLALGGAIAILVSNPPPLV
jgi:leader peptidase (prepilin peptidase) / N-methyltransferase